MVNNSWKSVTLSQIGTFQKGSGISRAESNSGVLPAVRYGELYTVHNNYVRTYTSHISREVANKALRVHYGDVLFACSGETKEDIAKCAAIIDNSEVYAGGDIIVLSPTTEVDPIFLGFILNTPNVIQQRAQKAQGDAIVHISADSIKSIEITVPEYAEQVKIAKVLYDIDTLIVNLEKLIAKKKAIKQGAMQELLTGKRRLPGFDGEWTTTSLKNVLTIFNGYAFKSSTYDNNTGIYKVITIANVQNGYLIASNCNMLLSLPSDIQQYQILKIGDLLISMTGNVGRVCFVTESHTVLNQRVGKLVVSDKHYAKFVFNALNTPWFLKAMITAAKGGAQPNLGIKDIYEYELHCPSSIEEEKAISNIIDDMQVEIDALEQKISKLINIRVGMMSELLTGRVRLIDKEDA